jgi:hypothetical protein
MTVFEKRNFYFRKFPLVTYHLQNEDRLVMDFLHRWAFVESVKSNASAYSQWTIRESDTLRGIAMTLYGSEHYFWVIMMMNDMIDPLYDWPLSDKDLKIYVDHIYGAENVNNVHHYVSEFEDNIYALPEGIIVPGDYEFNKESVTNYEHEYQLNEDKRIIKLLKPEYMDRVKTEKERIISLNFGA